MWDLIVILLLTVQDNMAETNVSHCQPRNLSMNASCIGRYGPFASLDVNCYWNTTTNQSLQVDIAGFLQIGQATGQGSVSLQVLFEMSAFKKTGMDITCVGESGSTVNITLDKDSQYIQRCWNVSSTAPFDFGDNQVLSKTASIGSKEYIVDIPMIGGMILIPELKVIQDVPPISSLSISGLSPGVQVTRFGSDILDIEVKDEDGKVITDFTNNTITLSFSTSPYDPEKEKPVCSFLDEGTGSWSSEGCNVSGTSGDSVQCECDHLTNFAILMQTVEVEISQRDEKILSLLTVIGLILSITFLALTLITYALCRLRSVRIVIHGNLAFAMMTSQVIFLFVGTIEKAGCRAVAVLLHFFLLATFTWMAIEGVFLLIKSTPTFTRKVKMPVWLVIGWGFPVVIVGISLGARITGYGDPGRCWLSLANGFNWAFLAPSIFIIVFNGAVLIRLILIFMSLQTNKKKSEAQKMKAGIRLVLILEPLLGFPWLLGLLYFDSAMIIFAYVFIICNSLQGVFLFVSQCFWDEEVRQKLRLMYAKRSSRVSTMASSSFSQETKATMVMSQKSEVKSVSGKETSKPTAADPKKNQDPTKKSVPRRKLNKGSKEAMSGKTGRGKQAASSKPKQRNDHVA